jgi:hypothetical protein
MEQSPPSEANRSSARQDIPRILWNPTVHYRVYTALLPVPILSQINPVPCPHPASWRPILILSSHVCLGLPSDLLPSGPPHQNPVCTSPAPCLLLRHRVVVRLSALRTGRLYTPREYTWYSFLLEAESTPGP